MDICVLNPYFYPYNGGTEKVLLEVYRRLAKRHNVTVLSAALRNSNRNSVEEIDGIRVVRLKSSYVDIAGLPLPFAVMHGVPGAIAKAGAEVYHINNRFQFFKDSINAIRKVDGKSVLTVHNALPMGIDLHTDALGLFYDSLWGRGMMHDVDAITGISKNTIDTTVPQSERHKTQLIYNGVDHKKYTPMKKSDRKLGSIRSSLGIEGQCIVTNGRLITQKGQAYLMEAVSRLIKERQMNLTLVIIGTGPLREQLGRLSRKLGMEKNFRIVSGIKEELMPRYYNLGDIFSLPSLYEPASLAILEALSCAMPCITSRVGGLPEMMGRYGYYSKPKDVDELMEKIIYVLSNKKKAEALGREGRKLVERRNDWDRISRQYEELFTGQLRY
ncbi:MAG TPA: glycosyltransferase family 4 protein [Candidatus Baltobacteraceae bacterium]|nr:glycosyltransferase family 4 protein [Candidatus Baltobacteraceae bacterium]